MGSGIASTVPAAEPAIDEHVDAAVVGAGPAGATAALTLARRGARVLLVDRRERRGFPVGEGLPPAARPLLERLGLWERFRLASHLPSHGNRSAWGSTELAETEFIMSPYGHGWHLDRGAFDAMLVAAAEEAGASRACVTDVAWEPSGSGGVLHLGGVEGESSVHAQAVLDCSGRVGAIARRHGARRVHRDRLVAVAALHVPGRSGDVDSTTLVEATRDGWWYTALLPGDRRIFVYLTDGDLLDVRAARDVACWLRQLRGTRHLGGIHERFRYRVLTGPMVVPARSSKLRSPLGRGWLAAGDAALSFDPLSSQGITTAMSTGRDAAESVLDALDCNHTTIASYLSRLDELDRDYMARRAQYYGLERRWGDRPFWRRRYYGTSRAHSTGLSSGSSAASLG